MDITNLRFDLVKRTDVPELVELKNDPGTFSSKYDYGTIDRDTGTEIIIQSIITNMQKSYTRTEHLLVPFEQTHFTEVNDQVCAELIRLVIFQHARDLEVKINIPSNQSIVNFILSNLN